jgi:hypothetical protein
MSMPSNPTPSESTEKMGKLEGALLGVIGLIAVLTIGAGIVIGVTSIVLGGNALDLSH